MKKISTLTSSIVYAGICLLIFSCSNEPKVEEVIVVKEPVFKGFHVSLDSIIRKKEGTIHGFELGDPRKAVKSYETVKPEEEDSDYSLFSYPIDSLSSYTIAYTFVKDTLDEAEVQITCKSIDTGAVILNSLKQYYSEKYATPLLDKGIYVFNCYDSRKRNFKISLTDNSTAQTAIINVLVYREK